jgi:acyl-CoA synthetase (AMP-forming)/AMP-acid ligase II
LAPVPSNFADLILLHARVRPEKPAIVLADRVVTYDMMAQAILRVEDRIRAVGLPAGGLVGLSIDSPIRHMILAAALFRLGHPTLSVDRVGLVLPLALPIAAFLQNTKEPLQPGPRQIAVTDDWFDGERKPIAAHASAGFADDQAICRVELSSGTTGRPKAISLTARALQQWVMNYFATIGFGVWDRLLLLPGLTSSWGFSIAAHALFAGRTLFFAHAPRDSLQMISVYGIEAAVASTQQLRALVNEQASAPVACPTLRAVLTGGSLVSRSLMQEAGARLCSLIINLYGSTEAGGTAFATIDRLTAVEGATGYVAPWAEVEIVDGEDRPLPPGADGVVRIRATCQGAPFPLGRTDGHGGFRDGWFYPGDLGRIEPGGLLVLSGRSSEVINVGGTKISPALIEDTLRTHPSVAEAAAFGSLGPGGIEEIVVVLVSRPPFSEAKIIEWCAERGIPVARVIAVAAMPKTPSGKVHREQLRQQCSI